MLQQTIIIYVYLLYYYILWIYQFYYISYIITTIIEIESIVSWCYYLIFYKCSCCYYSWCSHQSYLHIFSDHMPESEFPV